MASDGDSRYAPPGANVADVADPNAAVLASRWSRLFAAIVDSLAVMVPAFAVVLLLGAAGFEPFIGLFTRTPASPAAGRLLAGLLGIAIFLLINGYLLVDRGQTVGKVALGVRIVRRDGSKASAGRVLGLRYGIGAVVNLVPAISFLYALIDCLLIFRRSRRCLHDEFADTIVVRV